MCLLGRFLSCLALLESMGGILKLTSIHFLAGAVNRSFKIGVSGISSSRMFLLEGRLESLVQQGVPLGGSLEIVAQGA